MQSSRPSPRSPSPWATKGVDVATGAKTGRGGRVCRKKTREFGGGVAYFVTYPYVQKFLHWEPHRRKTMRSPEAGVDKGLFATTCFWLGGFDSEVSIARVLRSPSTVAPPTNQKVSAEPAAVWGLCLLFP